MKHNYFVLLIIFFIGSFSLFSQIVNIGTLKIMPATNVYFSNAYTNKGTHANNGNLYLKGDFINNGTTEFPISGTTFFNSTVNAVQTISGTTGSVNFFQLEIDNSLTGVSVTDGFGLIVTDAVALTNGDLRLAGEAQLIQSHTGVNANNVGTGKLLRDQQGITSKFGYNYWSSPVNNGGNFAINGGVFYENADPFTPTPFGFTTGLDGSAGTISERWLYTYSPNTAGYAGWVKIYRNSPIKPGEGFTMKGTGVNNQNYVFKGVPNNGDYSFNIVKDQNVLLGNPYPSALDAHKFINSNLDILDQIEIWVDGVLDPLSGSHYLADYLGGYATLNLATSALPLTPSSLIKGLGDFTGRSNPTQFVAVSQGFFVVADNDGAIAFNNSQRDFKTENGTDSFFYKSTTSINKLQKTIDHTKSIIRIGYEDPKEFYRQLALAFIPNSPANLNFNRGYDALMPEPREDELFFIIEKEVTKKYVIQGVNAFDENNEFDLGLIIKEAGEHTIMLDAVESFTGKVYIKDVLANITYNLSESNFIPNLPPGTYLDRFKLVFLDKTATVVAEDLNPNLGISAEKTMVYYHENESLIVRTKSDFKVSKITVYNTLGQQIKQVMSNGLDKNVFAIPFHYPIGVYLVIVESDLGKETFKIINK